MGRILGISLAALAATFVLGLAAPSGRAGVGIVLGREDAALYAARQENARVAAWRRERLERLTSDTGWLTLVGLFWLKEGENTFGRASSNALALDNAALPAAAGSFELADHRVRFIAAPGSGVTHQGQAVTELELSSDAQGEPTVLGRGPLRFFVIERAGHIGVRVRDLESPRRLGFRGLSYFPVSTHWVCPARFEAYQPAQRLKIVNILGMEEEVESPGAVIFEKDGKEWRLDTVLEGPGEQELFIMFADATSGRETYGAGRFLYIPLPQGDSAQVDFNKAINPPCALNDFATCPLPPPQNRLRLRIDAGEKKYAGRPGHGS
jgi:uncharacterized protein (DUF1684 family)